MPTEIVLALNFYIYYLNKLLSINTYKNHIKLHFPSRGIPGLAAKKKKKKKHTNQQTELGTLPNRILAKYSTPIMDGLWII